MRTIKCLKKEEEEKNDPENMKKMPSKVAYGRPLTFFYLRAWLAKQPRNRNPVPPKAP